MADRVAMSGRRGGATPLAAEEPGKPIIILMPPGLTQELEATARRLGLPSRAAAVRLAVRRLVAQEATA